MRRRTIFRLIVCVFALCITGIVLRSAGSCLAQAGPGQTFNANGVTIWYDVHGDAPAAPLILINGGPGFAHSYLTISDVWDRLAAKRPVVFYDQRGTGRSEPWTPERPHSLLGYLDDLEALRTRLGAEKIDLLGHSWGGYLSMAYAIRHPERVRSLILCDSMAPRATDTLFLFKALFPDIVERQDRLAVLQSLGDRAAGGEWVRELIGTLFVSPAKRSEFLAKSENLAFNFELNQQIEADIDSHDLSAALVGFKVRALVLSGRFDANIGPETAWKLHKALAGSRVQFFENSGHFPFIEEPDLFYTTVDAFLEGS